MIKTRNNSKYINDEIDSNFLEATADEQTNYTHKYR